MFLEFLITAGVSPVFAQGYGYLHRKFKLSYHPIDFKKNFIDKKRILGDGKTFEGSFCAILASIIFGTILKLPISLSFRIGLGAVLGDIFESFIKRRLGIERGKDWYPYDNIDYITGAIVVAEAWKYFNILEILTLIIVGGAISYLCGIFAKKIKIK